MHQSLLANDHLSNEITINEIIIQEREEEFKQINKSIVEVNAIFKDLAVIVNEQAEDIETIESNMNESARMAEKGLKELQTAAKSQSSSRGKMVCLLFTLLGIVGAIVLWLFVFNQPKTPPT
jgi:t-SNARE complex subunit (syntaxin)